MNDRTIPSIELSESLTEEQLKIRLRGAEHDFVERKPLGQKGDWLQVAVSFANSAPIGWPAVLFVGVDNEGSPQIKETPGGKPLATLLENHAKSVNDVLEQTYPAIYRHIVPLHLQDGACLAVVIPGSADRPHFAGRSYVRQGPATIEASARQFDAMVAERQSLIYELRRQLGKQVYVHVYQVGYTGARESLTATIKDCNSHFVTVESDGGGLYSFSLSGMTLSLEPNRNILILQARRG